MSFDFTTLITDRTQADVAAAKDLMGRITSGIATEADLAEWNAAELRGAYNYTDLNRVGAAVSHVARLLSNHGYAPKVFPRMNWTEADYMEDADADAYLQDIAELRRQLAVLRTTPAAPESMDRLTISKANAIEQILVDVELVLQTSLRVQPRSAQMLLFSGAMIFPVIEETPKKPTVGMAVYTADGRALYTADGLPVYLLE